LSNNTLGTVDLGVFNNLTALQVLNLSGNSLDENWIKSGIFRGLHSLIILDLSSNHMSKIDGGLFQDLNALQVLDFGFNQVSHFLIDINQWFSSRVGHLDTLENSKDPTNFRT
jgi:Leucine-rich repeat (LRR) protein